MQAKVQSVSFPTDRRVIAVSDMHGNLNFFRGLLDKIRYSADDILVIVGDIMEKGSQSLELVRFLMEFSEKNTVYRVSGNCDITYEDVFQPIDEEFRKGFLTYLSREDRQGGLLHQMAAEINFPLTPDMDIETFREELLLHFEREFAFLKDLPDILESEQVRFVHAGLTSNVLAEQTSFQRMKFRDFSTCPDGYCQKFDNFMEQGIAMDKFCVVGHWPTCNYLRKGKILVSNAPYYAPELNVCSIDGGLEVKYEGQLNALILPGGDPSRMEFAFYDKLPLVTALDAQEESDFHALVWGSGRHYIEIVEVSENIPEDTTPVQDATQAGNCTNPDSDVIQVRQLSTGDIYWAPRHKIYTDYNGRLCCGSATDYAHKIRPGEQVSLVQKTSCGYLVRKDGIIGWYYGRIVENNVNAAL